MSEIELWKLFERTGSINDYLNYACTTEGVILEDGYAEHDGNEEVEEIE